MLLQHHCLVLHHHHHHHRHPTHHPITITPSPLPHHHHDRLYQLSSSLLSSPSAIPTIITVHHDQHCHHHSISSPSAIASQGPLNIALHHTAVPLSSLANNETRMRHHSWLMCLTGECCYDINGVWLHDTALECTELFAGIQRDIIAVITPSYVTARQYEHHTTLYR